LKKHTLHRVSIFHRKKEFEMMENRLRTKTEEGMTVSLLNNAYRILSCIQDFSDKNSGRKRTWSGHHLAVQEGRTTV
jgi:hypothetical protein